MPAISQTFFFTTPRTTPGMAKTSSVTYPAGVTGPQTYISDPLQADGYYDTAGLQTISYIPSIEVIQGMDKQNNFRGTIVTEATLVKDPTEADWFTVVGTEVTFDGTNQSNRFFNFNGNFTWIRAKVTISHGVLQVIHYNH